jgi:hypothetical protein
MTGKLFHIVCDYGSGDLAWSEIVSAIFDEGVREGVVIWPTTANSFDTISTGFTVAQLACRQFKNPANVFIFANCAPRKDAVNARKNNEGEGLLYVELNSGVRVLAVNSGYSLSFLRGQIKEVWSTVAQTGGSQFRSRDFFPISVAQLVTKGDLSFRDKQLDISVVPEPPSGVIGYVDSFGNIKTTFRQNDSVITSLKSGDLVKIKIGEVTQYATVSGGSFGVADGELAFAPGSSGHGLFYWELFKRGGSAQTAFGNPKPGSLIAVEVLLLSTASK